MSLCYNLTRVLNILGLKRFVAAVAKGTLVAPKRPARSGATRDANRPAACREKSGLTTWKRYSRKASAKKAGCVGARRGIRSPDRVAGS